MKLIIENILKKKFPDATISVSDISGDKRNYSVTVVSKAFCNLSLLKQHTSVMLALKSFLKEKMHSVVIKTSDSLEKIY